MTHHEESEIMSLVQSLGEHIFGGRLKNFVYNSSFGNFPVSISGTFSSREGRVSKFEILIGKLELAEEVESEFAFNQQHTLYVVMAQIDGLRTCHHENGRWT